MLRGLSLLFSSGVWLIVVKLIAMSTCKRRLASDGGRRKDRLKVFVAAALVLV